jgi:hypothetical protein
VSAWVVVTAPPRIIREVCVRWERFVPFAVTLRALEMLWTWSAATRTLRGALTAVRAGRSGLVLPTGLGALGKTAFVTMFGDEPRGRVPRCSRAAGGSRTAPLLAVDSGAHTGAPRGTRFGPSHGQSGRARPSARRTASSAPARPIWRQSRNVEALTSQARGPSGRCQPLSVLPPAPRTTRVRSWS